MSIVFLALSVGVLAFGDFIGYFYLSRKINDLEEDMETAFFIHDNLADLVMCHINDDDMHLED